MKPAMRIAALIFVVSCVCARAGAAPSVEEFATTETLALIKLIESSDAVFIRNGSDHTAKEAADHLRSKIVRNSKKLTTEEFVTKIASRSSQTGDVYKMRVASGEVMTSEEWLRAELKKMREARAGGADRETTGTVGIVTEEPQKQPAPGDPEVREEND